MEESTAPHDNVITARAIFLGERIETGGLERDDVLSTVPLAFRSGEKGIVALFRFGVAVFVNMSPLEEDEVLRRLDDRIVKPLKEREEDSAFIEIVPEKEDHITSTGRIVVRALSTEHTLLIADALATSIILAHDEKDVAAVFDVMEPLARLLAERGRTPGGRRALLKHIGNALLVQQRVSGLVAVAEKPDVLWERPSLERFYARLEDEYELKERAEVLTRKLAVISDTARALADIIDTERALRLEAIIVLLIAVEIVISMYQILAR
ncbi:MAG: RMD1 family protein [Pseudomonadota bacterium]